MFCFIVYKIQFQNGAGGGRLFFGFLDYINHDNRGSDGRCCDGSEDVDGHCPLPCDLIFQMSIFGLDGPNTTNRRPWDVPFNSSGESFLHSQETDQDIINPLTFTFDQWPGCLDIVVEIFDVDTSADSGQRLLQPVDNMTLQVALGRPYSSYTERHLSGHRAGQPSNLTVVLRYECDNLSNATQCPPGLSKNVMSLPYNIMECPTPPPPTSSSSTISVTTTVTSSQISTALMTSYGSEVVTETVSASHDATTSLSHVTMTSSSAEYSHIINPSMHSGRTTIIGSSTSMSVTPTPTTSPTPATTTTISPTKMTSWRNDVTSGMTPITTKEKNDGPMEYWGIILGAVLGVMVIIAAIGFFIYYRRRQALYKRQEIYTVTPRIVSVVEENGTAGRSDIPVETTQY
ncbi:hypothetical protein V1264_001559 [Littorina saxatilis]|uniref:Uncharacterized protein n=1 Tax=Littorina saxatilis TaxID=31220 RepID=A0AAN9GPV9_9CAEN